MPKHWSGRQLDLLQTHWADETLSLRDIAAAINNETGGHFSRNAIAGQAKRLGLALRRSPNRSAGPRPASARAATRIVPVNLQRRKLVIRMDDDLASGVHPDAPTHLGLTLFELGANTCRYPRGLERFTFCGQPSAANRPYCDFHQRLSYAPRDRVTTTAERKAA